MGLFRHDGRQGRWRLFRHDAGRAAGPPALAYVLLFAACQLVGHWSVQTYGAVVVWPANGVMLAALLQLHRRPAIGVIAACFAINMISNIFRGDQALFMVLNAVMNIVEVSIAAVLARRVCGAALDMRRPRRLFNFAIFAAVPAVAVISLTLVSIAGAARGYSPTLFGFTLHHLFDMELLGLLIVAPSLLLLARGHRFRDDAGAGPVEIAALVALVAATALWVFGQTLAPILFAIFPPLVLLAFRLSPPWTAGAIIMVAAIGGLSTLTGHGPITLTHVAFDPELAAVPELMRRLNVFNLFLICVVITALPITALSTERRRLTARLVARTASALAARRRAEQADAAKSRFLALMSHEMRTPLTGVTGYADLLSRRAELDTEARRQVETVRRSGEAMLRLVEDLLDFSRGGDEIAMEPVCLRDLVEEAVAPDRQTATAKRLAFVVDVEDASRTLVLTDRRRLRQTLHHLVANAVKFTDSGGVRLQASYADGRLVVTVRDTGCGICETMLPNLFQPFRQGDDSLDRNHEGAGVGLALARANAALLGGDITVETTQGQGSTFTLSIAAPAVETLEVEADLGDEGRATRVLVVDDHPVNRDLLRIMMQAFGCEVVEAADGAEAVAAAKASAFDLILMDVRMPVMDGLAATRAIRALAGDAGRTPILAVTADAMPEDALRCLDAGMDAHLPKPVTQARLLAAVDQALAAAAERESVAA